MTRYYCHYCDAHLTHDSVRCACGGGKGGRGERAMGGETRESESTMAQAAFRLTFSPLSPPTARRAPPAQRRLQAQGQRARLLHHHRRRQRPGARRARGGDAVWRAAPVLRAAAAGGVAPAWLLWRAAPPLGRATATLGRAAAGAAGRGGWATWGGGRAAVWRYAAAARGAATPVKWGGGGACVPPALCSVSVQLFLVSLFCCVRVKKTCDPAFSPHTHRTSSPHTPRVRHKAQCVGDRHAVVVHKTSKKKQLADTPPRALVFLPTRPHTVSFVLGLSSATPTSFSPAGRHQFFLVGRVCAFFFVSLSFCLAHRILNAILRAARPCVPSCSYASSMSRSRGLPVLGRHANVPVMVSPSVTARASPR